MADLLKNGMVVQLRSSSGDFLHKPEADGVGTWHTGKGNYWTVVNLRKDMELELMSWKGDFLHKPDRDGVTTWHTGKGNKWTLEVYESPSDDYDWVQLKSWKGDYLCVDGCDVWSLVIKDDLVGVDFDINKAQTIKQNPEVINSMVVVNDTNEPQPGGSLTYTEQVTETTSTTHRINFEYSISSEFKCGFPMVSEGKMQVGFKFGHGHEFAVTRTTAVGQTLNFQVTAPPKSTTTAKAVCNKYKMSVPYTMKFASGKRVKGIWKGVPCTSVFLKYE